MWRAISNGLMSLGVVNGVVGLVALILDDLPAVGWFALASGGFVVTALCVDWVRARW